MASDLTRAFSTKNLTKAWEWILSNPDWKYKQYFRHLYRAYSVCSSENLAHLALRLREETYTATTPVRVYCPKRSGILRPYTLLSIEDQIVYQALANIVAPKLYATTRKRYLKTVFGNLYAGGDSDFFYADWRETYPKFSKAYVGYVKDGWKYAATFDLTACYDSIDYGVLEYELDKLGLNPEFAEKMISFLRRWTACCNGEHIEKRHGIPQGPLTSGLISECVLRRFDDATSRTKSTRYLRYVDDIRLLAKSETQVRRSLIDLDLMSKKLGLFPQSAKIDIHPVKEPEREIRTFVYSEDARKPARKQERYRRLVLETSKGLRVLKEKESQFKRLLGRVVPDSALALRLLEITRRQPHLYLSTLGSFLSMRKLSRKVTKACLEFLREDDLYSSVTAAVLRALRGRYHSSAKQSLHRLCRTLAMREDPELVAEANSILLADNALEWKQVHAALDTKIWWTRTVLLSHVRREMIGKPSFDALVHQHLKDKQADVALVAAIVAVEKDVVLPNLRNLMHPLAQISLKSAGMIGRVISGKCPIADMAVFVLGDEVRVINWRKVCGEHYKPIRRRIGRWLGYSKSDPSAWVNMTDTINDLILDALRKHDPATVKHEQGNFGSTMNAKSQFTKKYPALAEAVQATHKLRLESDLSHPVTTRTASYTRPIRWKEICPLKQLLRDGYIELWENW